MYLTEQISRKAAIEIAYDQYYYGFDIVSYTKDNDIVADKHIKLNEEQDINAILYFLGLINNVNPDTIKSKIFTWNKHNNICDSTIVSLNHYKKSKSVICKDDLSPEYKYYYIKNKNIEISLTGQFDGDDFIFENGHYKYIINAQSGQLTVLKNGVIILQKDTENSNKLKN